MADDDGDWLRPLLADLPDPPIPTDVADRITAALQAESAVRAQRAEQAGGLDTSEGSAAASLAAVASPELLADHASPRRRRRGGGYRTWLVAAGGIAAAGVVAAAVVTAMPGSSQDSGVTANSGGSLGSTTKYHPVSTGAAYTQANLTSLVARNLRASHAPANPAFSSATFAATDDGIDSCLAGVGNPTQELAMLDLADYQDAHVAVLAYLKGADDATIDVVVVGVRCNRDDPQVQRRDVAYRQP